MNVHKHKINIIKYNQLHTYLYNHVCKQVILVIILIFFPRFDWLNLSITSVVSGENFHLQPRRPSVQIIKGLASNQCGRTWAEAKRRVTNLGRFWFRTKNGGKKFFPQTSGRTLTYTPDTLEFGPYEPWNLLPSCQFSRCS